MLKPMPVSVFKKYMPLENDDKSRVFEFKPWLTSISSEKITFPAISVNIKRIVLLIGDSKVTVTIFEAGIGYKFMYKLSVVSAIPVHKSTVIRTMAVEVHEKLFSTVTV